MYEYFSKKSASILVVRKHKACVCLNSHSDLKSCFHEKIAVLQ